MSKLSIILVVCLIFSLSGCNSDNAIDNDTNSQEIASENIIEKPEESKIDLFIKAFNESSKDHISEIEEINVTDKSSVHYRTEFRLQAFSDSRAITSKYKDTTVDIVNYGYNKENIRVYATGQNFEQIIEIVQNSSLILDETLTKEELKDAVSYLKDKKTANGYYYGNIGIVLFGGYGSNYDLMMKSE